MNGKHSTVLWVVSLLVALAPARPVAPAPVYLSGAREQLPYVLLEPGDLASPDGVHPVFRPADAASGAAQKAARLLEQSFARQALTLHQYVKNYLAHQAGDPAIAAEPTYLFLGGDGGYARLGFWLEDAGGQLVDKRATSYVGGLLIDEGRWGDLEQLFPHELGHAMLRELSGWPRGRLAAQVHQVTLISDYAYAFDEGWGEHLQTVAVDHTANASVQALREQPLYVGEGGPYACLARELKGRCFPCPAKLSLLMWHSQREQHLRYAGVKSNLLARQVVVPPVLLARADPYDALLYQAIVPPDPSAPLKNGPQMLASEGLIAALFYRLVNDPRLQQSYRKAAFYASFAPPGRQVDWTQTSPQALFSPLENVYLKLFAVLARHVRLDGHLPGQSPALLMLRGYAADYPDEAGALYDVFLEITQGVTVSPGALPVAQDWAAGRLSASQHQAYLADLRQRLLTGGAALDSALPPQLWLRNPDALVGVAVLDVYRSLPRPYHFNLNAATVADLRTVPGVDVALARQIVRVRDERGGFSSLDDVPGLSLETLDRMRRMQDAMRAWSAQGGSDPEGEINVRTLIWSLLRRLLLGLALASTLAGLTLIGGGALQAASARRLGLQSPPPGQERAAGRPRRIVGRVGWALCALVLPVTLFFLAQVLLLASSLGHALGLAFAIALWLLAILPRLGWGLARRGLGWRVALHRAAWGLAVYVALFLALGWLMGV